MVRSFDVVTQVFVDSVLCLVGRGRLTDVDHTTFALPMEAADTGSRTQDQGRPSSFFFVCQLLSSHGCFIE